MTPTRIIIFGHADAHKLATIAAEFARRGPVAPLDLSGRTVDDITAAVNFHNVLTHTVIAAMNHLDPELLQQLTDSTAVTPGDTIILRLWSVTDWVNNQATTGLEALDDKIRFLAYPFYTLPYDRGEEAIAEAISNILFRGQLV